MLQVDLEKLRNDYSDKGIDLTTLPSAPIPLFSVWFEQAVESGISDPNGMVIATCAELAEISQRTVLMKSFDEKGICFYTNYTSRKSRQLNQNPHISGLFPWLALHRQVSFQGEVRIMDPEQSKRYFHSRPRGSQIGAWASRQSERMSGREELEQRVQELETRFAGREVPYPEFWGGFEIQPVRVEFWQGRNSRLHDRVVYSRSSIEENDWEVSLLNP
ncbi:MAG: pyridoxamine 5'-phosphate oxidase [Acidiferrobacterales bacterium]|nr:pyridoxamine 5'-phosphate oxidase [Acidiferrobacterales bacterium]